MHLVVGEATRDGLLDSYQQCIALAAVPQKYKKDAGKLNKKVWEILSNATLWKFIYIDDSGNLYTSKDFTLTLPSYDSDELYLIFRCFHHIVQSCFEASPPPSPEKQEGGLSGSW